MFKKVVFGILVSISLLLVFPKAVKANEECLAALKNLERHGPRGFVGVQKPDYPFPGLMPWGSRIYTVNSVEQILPHQALEKNIGNHHFYAVTSKRVSDELHDLYDTKDDNQRAQAQEKVAALFNDVLSESKIYWVQDGKVVQVPEDFVKANFLPEKMAVTKQIERGPVDINPSGVVAHGENAFYVRGWFLPPWRGLIPMEHAVKSLNKRDSTYNEISKRIAKQLPQGYRYDFNSTNEKEFQMILDYLADQKRTIRHLEIPNLRVPVSQSANRFGDESGRQAVMKEFKAGKFIGVMKRDPNGKILAVSMINKDGNLYEPDTVGYEEGKIDQAKDLIFVMMDVFGEMGYSHVDGAMATNFTQSMGGNYNPYEVYLDFFDALPKEEIQKDWTFQWTGPKFLIRKSLQN